MSFMAIEEIFTMVGVIVGFGIAIPLLVQFVARVSANIALGATASSEETSRIATATRK